MLWRVACLLFLAPLVIGLLAFYAFVENLPQRRPDVIELSPSQQYIVERVPLDLWVYGEALSYLRIRDQHAPRYIYRSPLYPTRLLDMQLSESKGRVSIPGVVFLVDEKKFIFRARRWEEHWMNDLVSNVPYAVEPLNKGDK